MKKRFIAAGLMAAVLSVSLYGCGDSDGADSENGTVKNEISGETGEADEDEASGGGNAVKFDIQSETVEENEKTVAVRIDGKLTAEGADEELESSQDNTITLKGSTISDSAQGVSVKGTTATITKAGTYIVTGSLEDGQIVVDTEDKETVWLVLCDADISNSTNSPIYIVNSKKTILSAASGTENTLSDAEEYTYAVADGEEPDSCIFSKDDLVISGDGKLTVNGNFNNGIVSKDTLEINDIRLGIVSKNNGIKGKDYVVIKSGEISVTSGGDGIKSNNADDAGMGYVLIENGSIDVKAGEDGIQAETCLKITGGDIDIKTGDGAETVSSSNMWRGGNTEDTESVKGIKAGVDITVEGGSINVNSEDDALHTNGTIAIEDGTISLASGDDGIHSDTELVIDGGSIEVTQSYEGLESASIVVNGGRADVRASDDGINAAGGNDSSSQGGRPGMNSFSSAVGSVNVNGGYIYLNADGDGLDSNGSVAVTDGTIIIDGPVNDGNGALDYDTEFTMTGGLLVAAGSSGMLQTVSESSTQNCIAVVTETYQNAETLFNISDNDGNSILTYKPSKKYNSVVVCSADISEGGIYTVSLGGESTGMDDGNGLYTGGVYAGGTEEGSVTIKNVVSMIGNAAGGMGGMGGMGDKGGMGGRPEGGRR